MPENSLIRYTLDGDRTYAFESRIVESDTAEGASQFSAVNTDGSEAASFTELKFTNIIIPRTEKYQLLEFYDGISLNSFGERATFMQVSGFIIAEKKSDWELFKKKYLYNRAYTITMHSAEHIYNVKLLTDTSSVDASNPNMINTTLSLLVIQN